MISQGEKEERVKFRIGKLSYLNNAPMYYALDRNLSSLAGRYEIVEGPPSHLNQCIRQKKIDLTVASSIVYARNFEHYAILPDLSIGSDGPVKSVLLVSRVPMERLDKQPLLLTSDSETSVALVKILLSQRGVEPVYVRGNVLQGIKGDSCFPPDYAAFLIIGDSALLLREKGSYPFIYDLGGEWKKMTGLPFVFALWIVRQEAFYLHGELVFQIWQALCASRHYSLTHPEEFIASVRTPAELSKEVCLRYIQKDLRYELSARYREGLIMYYRFLYELGEIHQPVQELNLLSRQ